MVYIIYPLDGVFYVAVGALKQASTVVLACPYVQLCILQ